MRFIKVFLCTIVLVTLALSIHSCSEESNGPKEPDEERPGESTVLMFVANEDVYYSEYIVMKEALEAEGYGVEVRSAATGTASVYMLPAGTTISETAGTLPGSGYEPFKEQFSDLFGADWNESLNVMPATLEVDGKIQDVASMEHYAALVIVGGTGALAYRVDGSFSAQGAVTSTDVETAALKLNALAVDALSSGKPVMAQCHSASLPAFWKIPGTTTSLLDGQFATGFPEPQTGVDLAALGVNYRAEDKVVVSSPAVSFNDNGNGDYRIITTRDWYPQTVAHAARTLLNILESYPDKEDMQSQKKVLLLHGGAVDPSNCGPGNRSNDVPCNYGGGENLPADFSDVKALLTANPGDGFSFVVTDVNLTGASLPFDAGNKSSIDAYLSTFDVVIFFKHWSTGITTALQSAIISFADNGGGVLGLHHALYNDIDDANASLNKNLLVDELFACQSAELGWGAERTAYRLYSMNYGHFISTFGVPIANNPVLEAPGAWDAVPMKSGANASLSVYQNFEVFDEIYTNKVFVANAAFGRDVNEITPLFSNNLAGGQAHTEGYVRMFDKNGDNTIGRVAFFQPGETKASFSATGPYGRVVRNAVVWLAQ